MADRVAQFQRVVLDLRKQRGRGVAQRVERRAVLGVTAVWEAHLFRSRLHPATNRLHLVAAIGDHDVAPRIPAPGVPQDPGELLVDRSDQRPPRAARRLVMARRPHRRHRNRSA